MTKYTRELPFPAFNEEGGVEEHDGRLLDVHLGKGAYLTIASTAHNLEKVRIECSWWFDLPSLEKLIAELIFLKEEWENHPLVLGRQQEEDMEELEEDWIDEDEQERIIEEEEALVREEEQRIQRERMDALLRGVEEAAERWRNR